MRRRSKSATSLKPRLDLLAQGLVLKAVGFRFLGATKLTVLCESDQQQILGRSCMDMSVRHTSKVANTGIPRWVPKYPDSGASKA